MGILNYILHYFKVAVRLKKNKYSIFGRSCHKTMRKLVKEKCIIRASFCKVRCKIVLRNKEYQEQGIFEIPLI